MLVHLLVLVLGAEHWARGCFLGWLPGRRIAWLDLVEIARALVSLTADANSSDQITSIRVYSRSTLVSASLSESAGFAPQWTEPAQPVLLFREAQPVQRA